MTNFQILIVDQRRKSREELRADILDLGSEINVTAVPSGEEALLEMGIQAFDVLVSNIRLPGMDGVELLAKARNLRPDLKVILIEQGSDSVIPPGYGRESADAVFSAEEAATGLLDAIQRCVDFSEDSPTIQDEPLSEKDGLNIDKVLSDLHISLGSMTSVILDGEGRIQAKIGDFPDPKVVPPIIAAYNANRRVERYLGFERPGDVHYFPGLDYDIYLASVGESLLLVEFFEPVKSKGQIGEFIGLIARGIEELDDVIHIETASEETLFPDDQEGEMEGDALEIEEPLLDAILQETDKNLPEAKDVDAFWETVTRGETDSLPQDHDVLTYDQAVELGLGLDEGDE